MTQRLLFLFVFFSFNTFAFEAPVTDLASSEDEMARIKRQVSHLIELNLLGKIENLQQEVQTLRGTVEKQSHEIQTLKNQRTESQDLKTDQTPKKEPFSESPTSDYDKAIEAIRNKKYSEAQDLLIQFLSLHSKDKLAGNAHFWLGEVYYQLNKKHLAKREFKIIQKQYPTNPKAANALLKLGYIEMDEENFGQAREIFKSVIQTFPDTPSAHLAKIKLDKLTKSKEE